MSLFQAREWWSVRNGSGEEFDRGCMAVGNVDNEQGENVKIVTGSYQGYLRIYYPRQNQFKVEDLLHEHRLNHPILRVAIGKFLQNSTENALAVLHPRYLVVYLVELVGSSYYKLNKRYEHRLGQEGEHFTAYNLTYGGFGEVHGKDMICVQSLDGQLAFFEQENFSFYHQLETCLVPGPLCYASQIDSLLTSNSEMNVECYKYQALVLTSKGNRISLEGKKEGKKGEEIGFNRTRKLQVDWVVNVGEIVLDIQVARYTKNLTPSQFDILVLCQHTLFFLKGQGGIRAQKRLGYSPTFCCLYNRQDKIQQGGGNQNLIIGTHCKKWMIYKDMQLIWSACVPSAPIELAVATFGVNAGMIVSLDEEGLLSVNYLGTDPPSTAVRSTESSKEINYEEMDEEHRKLLSVIRDVQREARLEPKEKILLRAQVPNMLDVSNEMDPVESETMDEGCARNSNTGSWIQVTVRLFVSYTGSDTVYDVSLAIQCPEAVKCTQSSMVIACVDGNASTPLIVPLVFRADNAAFPTSRCVRILAVYTTEEGQPRTAICEIKLPMCLFCRLVPPIKSNLFKFTLETNKAPPLLTELYEDLFIQPGTTSEWIQKVTESSANVLSFQYFNGGEVIILVSKNAGRYRIQSSALESLYFVTQDLIYRLELLYKSKEADAHQEVPDKECLMVSYEEPLPLADLFAVIDEHFECRKKISQVSSEINDRSHQFRVIEKRLLTRFKERNPTPLQNLDVLLHQTYENLMALANQMESLQKMLQSISNRLSSSVYLILLLIRYRFKMDEESFLILSSHLTPSIDESGQHGWEEITDASMTTLLRTVLARQSKDVIAPVLNLEFPEDTKKLKKHITIICDRLAKGATLKTH